MESDDNEEFRREMEMALKSSLSSKDKFISYTQFINLDSDIPF